MPVVSAEPVVPAACIFFSRRAMGAASIRHSPRPLAVRAGTAIAQLGRDPPRERAVVRPKLSRPETGAYVRSLEPEGGFSGRPRARLDPHSNPSRKRGEGGNVTAEAAHAVSPLD
jgi:hypothetical protein